MLQADDYLTVFDRSFAWGVYLGAALVVLAVLFWLSRRWQRNLRWLMLLLLAIAALMPATVPGHAAKAPAFIFIVMGMLMKKTEVVAPVLVQFSLAAILAVVVVVIEGVWWRSRQGTARAPSKGAAKP